MMRTVSVMSHRALLLNLFRIWNMRHQFNDCVFYLGQGLRTADNADMSMMTVEVALKFDDTWRHTVSTGYSHNFNIDANAGSDDHWNSAGSVTASTDTYTWGVSTITCPTSSAHYT